MVGYCVVVLRDHEGSQFTTWEPRDVTEMKVTDDAETPNTIFRGYLINKKFHSKNLILEIAGIGIMLYRKPFGHEESINYILATGYPKTLNASSVVDVHYKDANGDWADFDWVNHKWILGDVNVGFVIKDLTSGYSSKYWDCDDPIAQTGGTVQDGDYASTITYNNSDYYEVRDESDTPDLVITATMEGDLVAVAGNYPKEIQIEYSFRSQVYFGFFGGTWNCYLEIAKDGGWERIDQILYSREYSSQHTSGWAQKLDSSLKEGSVPHSITEGGDATELAKYITLDVGENNYESMTIRLRCTGNLPSDAWGEAHIDYLRVKFIYHTEDVEPVMYKITDSGLNGDVRTITCGGVADWTAMGVTVDVDGFQIGENTNQIVQDIASAAGLNIDIISSNTEEVVAEVISPDAVDSNDGWTPIGGGGPVYVDEDSGDTPDGNYWICGNGIIDGSGSIIIFGMETIPEASVITGIKVYLYSKRESQPATEIPVDVNLGGWLGGEKTLAAGNGAFAWDNAEWTELTGTQDDLDELQIKFTCPSCIEDGYYYLECVYVEVTYQTPCGWLNYIARKFKGCHCIDVLQSVLTLEGAEWMEDYANNRIKLIKKADFEDSGVSITQTEYEDDWEYEDLCNAVKYVYVWGKTTFNPDARETSNIFYKAISTVATEENAKQIIDDSIWTIPEAQRVAEAQLALLEYKRPSIRIPLDGVNEDIQMGTYVNVTMARPTVAAANYKIRMIQRTRRGKTGIKTIVYCGFGETQWDEKITKEIEKATSLARRGIRDRLTSAPYDVGVGGISWADVMGAEDAVDALIATHATNATAHQDLSAALMIGSTNSAMVPCIFEIEHIHGNALGDLWGITNVAGNTWWTYKLPLPTNRGALKLYCKDVQVDISAADANDYLNQLLLQGVDYNSTDEPINDGTNRTAAGQYTYTNAVADDMSSYTNVLVSLLVFTTTAGEFSVRSVLVECYYDT